MIEFVYKNRDNPNIIIISEDGTPIDFTTATRMVLSFDGSPVVADTDINNTLIDWSQGGGIVEFNINDLPISFYRPLPATLTVYDPAHLDGQTLIHSTNRQLYFSFIE